MKIKFAVIGQGHIGKRHAEMIRRNPETELVAVCDVFPNTSVDLPENDSAGKEKYYPSIDQLLSNHPETEVVNICTPNGLHIEHCLKALEANKHLVVEKPLALRRQDCEQILSKALQKHKQVFCVMQNRYSPPSVWLKKIVEEKIIGDIFIVQLNCYWNRDERYYKNVKGKMADGRWQGTQKLDGGTLFTQFSHWIDLLYWLFGDITEIQAKFANFNHNSLIEFEDSGFVNFCFLNGGMGSINYSTSIWDKNFESSITIVGSKGTVKVSGQYMDKVEYCHIKDYKMSELSPTAPANDYGSYKISANNHHFVIQNVVDTLKERTTITTNAMEGMKVVEIIEKIYSFRKSDIKN